MTDTTVYSGRVTNWPLFWLANAIAGALFVSAGLADLRSAPVVIAAAVLVVANLVITSVRTTAGPGGVVVRYGVFGLPRFRYANDEIESAEAIDVPFAQMGGWGIHWSPWRGTRLTIRSGPSLRLHLRRGHTVTVSVEHPEAAVAVLDNRPAHMSELPGIGPV
jgi:hypothetical protein